MVAHPSPLGGLSLSSNVWLHRGVCGHGRAGLGGAGGKELRLCTGAGSVERGFFAWVQMMISDPTLSLQQAVHRLSTSTHEHRWNPNRSVVSCKVVEPEMLISDPNQMPISDIRLNKCTIRA
jgi:hypothetical protein